MPFYKVEHSYPLGQQQKEQIAKAITKLHSTKFVTPSVFVHVSFKATDASDNNYFVAGKVRTNSTNRITAMVRTSESRTKKHWEELSADIENAWYTAVSGELIEEGQHKGKRSGEVDDTIATKEAKSLRFIGYTSLVDIWENGGCIPSAGEEAGWLKERGDEFRRLADAGDEICKELMDEVTTREDLKKAYGT